MHDGEIPNVRSAMITGAQIRDSLKLLGWSALELAERARIGAATIIRAEAADGAAEITIVQENAIRLALTAAGIEFAAESDGRSGVRLGQARFKARSVSGRKAEVVTKYLGALRAKLGALKPGDTSTVQGADALSLLFPPGVSGEDLDPRAEAIISTFAESGHCDYDYEPNQAQLRFIKR
jgi:transcriptional regulator with XRE-family HTH domain